MPAVRASRASAHSLLRSLHSCVSLSDWCHTLLPTQMARTRELALRAASGPYSSSGHVAFPDTEERDARHPAESEAVAGGTAASSRRSDSALDDVELVYARQLAELRGMEASVSALRRSDGGVGGVVASVVAGR